MTAACMRTVVLLGLTVGAVTATGGDSELGRHLASQCLACHSAPDGIRMPGLSGMSERDFTEAIDSFRSRRRTSQIMSPIAERLSDEDIAALARYFAGTSPDRRRGDVNP